MRDWLLALLLLSAAGSLPVLAGFLAVLARALADRAAMETGSGAASAVMNEVAAAVENAVGAVNQTYVDALKKAGAFGKEAQRIAARRALDACTDALSPAAEAFIQRMYGNPSKYLSTRIEAEVRNQKRAAAS